MAEGRWPANVILSPGMAEALDVQSGTNKSTPWLSKPAGTLRLHGFSDVITLRRAAERGDKCPDGADAATMLARHEASSEISGGYSDEGGASRFFLTAGYEPWELEWILANGLTPCGAW